MNPGRPPTSAPIQQQQDTPSGTINNRVPRVNDDLSTVATGSGRSEWRRDEHGRFMQALEIYGSRRTGNEWKHITAFVGSRTIEEVHLHGRQYLHRLVQQLPPSPEATSASRHLSGAGSQNDPNRQNYQVRGGDQHKSRGKRPIPAPSGGSSALSAAALECAQSMSIQASAHFHNQPLQHLQHQHQTETASRRNGRRSKPWTFQQDKAFETALAGWTGSKSYPWPRIAEAIPGKTVKDVRNRYEEMVGEIASIESGEIPAPEPPMSGLTVARSPCSTSTLSQRAVPPPPIEVPLRSVGKDGTVSVFPSGRSTGSRRGSASGITMLSPTFLDLLAKEAESEEKSPLPFPGLTNLPSPLFSPTLLPSGSPGFFSPGTKKSAARGQQDKKLSSLESSGDVKMEEIDTTSAATGKSTTPRIWNDFLAGDFKFDDPLGTPSHSKTSRKTPRSKIPSDGSSTSENDPGKQNNEMPDASAA